MAHTGKSALRRPRGTTASARPRCAAAVRRRPQARGAATRERLLKAAERLFVREGFAAVGVERIVRAAAVTKGAFYHHFTDKLAVFRAVFEARDREMAQRVMQEALKAPTPLQQVQRGMRASFELSTQPRYGRMIYIEAPAVLGWELWHGIDSAIAGEAVTAGLLAAVDAGELAPQSVPALTTLLLGALLQGGIAIATAADPPRTAAALADEMDGVLRALASAAGARAGTKR